MNHEYVKARLTDPNAKLFVLAYVDDQLRLYRTHDVEIICQQILWVVDPSIDTEMDPEYYKDPVRRTLEILKGHDLSDFEFILGSYTAFDLITMANQ